MNVHTHIYAYVCFNTHLLKKFHEPHKCACVQEERKPKKRADHEILVKTVLIITKPLLFLPLLLFPLLFPILSAYSVKAFFFPVGSFHPQFSAPATH